MAGYASVAEEARRAFAAVARLEAAALREPASQALQMNLAARRKLAGQLRSRLLDAARDSHIEVCNYRLIQTGDGRYGLSHVSESLLCYQNLFTQIHDARKNGPKERAVLGADALDESQLEVGYIYSGSLGIVLMAPGKMAPGKMAPGKMAPGKPDLFRSGALNASIDTLFRVIEIGSAPDVRAVARDLGNAVVKRVHDWSAANVRGGFDADVRWTRSDGRQSGQLVERVRMERMAGIIETTSDVAHETLRVAGTLVGIDVKAGTFHLVVPNGTAYRGALAPAFDRTREMGVNRSYTASIVETRSTIYATDQTRRDHVLLALDDIRHPAAGPILKASHSG